MAWQTVSSVFQADTDLFFQHDRFRFRPLSVRGFVSGPRVAGGRTISTSLATIGILGGDPDAKIPHTEAGHLIALELGGADNSHNLVPMYGGVNRGTYRAIENLLGQKIASVRNPAVLVKLAYPELTILNPADYRIPKHMDVYFYTEVVDLSRLVPSASNLVRRVENTRHEAARMPIEGADIELRRRLIEIKNKFPTENWLVESLEPAFEKYLPAPDQRPNAWLDHLIYTNDHKLIAQQLLSKVSGGNPSIGPFWAFAPQQREFVALANRMTQPDARKGECWSDAGDNDPIQSALTELGTDDGIHIDHIHPMASGGVNIYSNASVTSALFNKQKGR